jgi:hypothetical protein
MPGMTGRFLGGVLAKGEFLICNRNVLSYTILVPGEQKDRYQINTKESEYGVS